MLVLYLTLIMIILFLFAIGIGTYIKMRKKIDPHYAIRFIIEIMFLTMYVTIAVAVIASGNLISKTKNKNIRKICGMLIHCFSFSTRYMPVFAYQFGLILIKAYEKPKVKDTQFSIRDAFKSRCNSYANEARLCFN